MSATVYGVQAESYSRVRWGHAGLQFTLLAAALIWTSVSLGEMRPQPVIKIEFEQGRLSVEAVGAPLKKLLREIGRVSGIHVHLVGDFDQTVTRSFSDLPIADAIQRLVGNAALLMIHDPVGEDGKPGRVREIRVYAGVFSEPQLVMVSPHAVGPMHMNPEVASTQTVIQDEEIHRRIRELNALGRDAQLDAMRALARGNDPEASVILGRILAEDVRPDVRIYAASALREMGDEGAVASLEAGLGDDDIGVRLEVVDALGDIGGDRALLDLGQVVFGEPDPEVRVLAVDHLARNPGEVARAFLEAAANDRSEEVRRAARDALGLE